MNILNLILLQAANGNAGGGMGGIIMIVAMIVVFYFFMIRPQQKQRKELRKQRDALGKGDKVLISGGIYGIVDEIGDTYMMVEIDKGVKVRVDKNSIYAVPANDTAAKK